MIYEDERTTDELVDEILGAGDGVREEKTEDAQDGSRWDIPGEGTERATCRRCGGAFLKPPKSKRTLCPACFSASVSAGMKASHARRMENREKRKAEAEAKRKETEDVEDKEKTVVEEAWAQLGEPEADTPEPAPRRAQDVLLDLYSTVRSIATAAGLDPSRTIEALWEIDNILGAVGRA